MSWSHPFSSLAALVRDRIDRWESDGQPCAAQVLAEHPQLREARSLVLDLALAEYSLRKEAGESIDKSRFCQQFPDYRQSLEHLLEVEDYLDCCPAYAPPAEPTRWPIPGEQFLGYEIVEPLGRGGLARVFLAREPAVGSRHVVIKVSQHGDHEAHTLGKLSHPGVVPIHSVQHDADGNWTILCMPLVGAATGIDLLDAAFHAPGVTRDAALVARVAQETRPLTSVTCATAEKRQFPWHFSYADAVCQLALDIAEALAAAHSAGVLHRDIKPSNLLLSWSNRAMLLDFNLSTRDELSPQRLGGTLAYMAPEIIASLLADDGKTARRFDPRCDVYSLGVVLNELLTGQLPCQPAAADRLGPTAYQPWLDCKQTLPDAAAFPAEIDRGLVAIVRKCLAFDPAERFADAASLAAALREHLSGMALARRLAKRRRRELVAALLALAASLVAIFAYVGSRPSELDTLYEQALAHYDAGEFDKAANTFTRCLELRAGWPQAHFGRAQSLRRQGHWQAARADYVALAPAEPAWAYALAGYCSLKANDYQTSLTDFRQAHKLGLRDIDFLLNYATAYKRRFRSHEAASVYSDVLAIEPNHKTALRERALMFLALAANSPQLQIDARALDDALHYQELEKGFDGPYLAARIFGQAARKTPQYQNEAIGYLSEAIKRGLPKHLVDSLPADSRWLVAKLPPNVLAEIQETPNRGSLLPAAVLDPPLSANWHRFLVDRKRQPLLASGN